jgi:endonuclease YncB( thermonuclease family)
MLVAAAVAAASTTASSDLKRSDPVLVRAVLDGDTIDVASYGRVRLLGIDAPEIGRGYDTAAPFGREARDRLTRLVLHRWVRLEQDAPALDSYNRHLAYVVTENGEFVNATLVREGLARVTARVPLARLDELKRAEAEAQAFRRGMWGDVPQLPGAGYTRAAGSGKRSAGSTKTPARVRQKVARATKPAKKKSSRKPKPAAKS